MIRGLDLFKAFFHETREYAMSVAVELKPKRRPCRNPQITKPVFLVDKIEIVMFAFAIRCL